MNQMVTAFNNVGVSISLKKRIWLWLKDHPDKTAAELDKVFNTESPVSLSVCLSELYNRGMVSRSKRYKTVLTRGSRFRYAYKALGKEYELLPRRERDRAEPAKPAKHSAAVPCTALPPSPVPPQPKTVGNFAINIENMTLAEARELYNQLKKLFG